MKHLVLGGLAAALAASSAAAHPAAFPSAGPTYFNRVGATQADHEAAIQHCQVVTGVTHHAAPSLWRPASKQIHIENCMVVAGWRIYRLPEDVAAALPSDPGTLSAVIAPWVGSETPPGVLVRSWVNDAGSGAASQLGPISPVNARSISLKAVPAFGLWPEILKSVSPTHELTGIWPGPKAIIQRPPDPMTLAVGPDQAVVVVTIVGREPDVFVWFERQGPDYMTAAWKDGRPYGFPVVADRIAKADLKRDGVFRRTIAFAVPPGDWKLATVGAQTLCLGAPITTVKAGEVVYLGSFDFGSEPFAPDLSLEPARVFLGAKPDLLPLLRPAVWSNGATTLCLIGNPYALEFPGAPSVPSRTPTR